MTNRPKILKVVPPTEWKMGLGCLPQLDRYLSQRQDRGQYQVAGVKELGFRWE